MAEKQTLYDQWVKEDAERQTGLERAKFCASISKPWVLPDEDASQMDMGRLPEPFTSLISRGITNLEGRLLIALYPPGVPWFTLRPAGKFMYDSTVDPAMLQQLQAELHLHEMMMLAKLEQADIPGRKSNRRRGGFRNRKRQALTQLLVTGDSLERLTDDYRIQVYRRDQYVTRRDQTGDVMLHIIKETVDPLTLSDEQLVTADIDKDVLIGKSVADRKEDLYTSVYWDPQASIWDIKQEVNRKTIVQSYEPVSPFLSTAFELTPTDHYGRGFVELNMGDCRTLNELHERLLDFAATASKQLWVTDYASQVRPRDLAKPSGSVIQARVAAGQVQDVACMKVDKISDFNVVYQTTMSKRNDLAQAMLMEGESTPTGERVTAYQVSRVAMELEGSLGGLYSPIADMQQIPLVERLMYQMRKDKILPALPEGSVEIEAVTGLPALSRERDQARLMNAMQALSQFGPEVMGRINLGELVDIIFTQSNVYHPGLVKSDEQLAAEEQARQQMQMQAAAQQEMVRTAGAVAEDSLTQGGGGQPNA